MTDNVIDDLRREIQDAERSDREALADIPNDPLSCFSLTGRSSGEDEPGGIETLERRVSDTASQTSISFKKGRKSLMNLIRKDTRVLLLLLIRPVIPYRRIESMSSLPIPCYIFVLVTMGTSYVIGEKTKLFDRVIRRLDDIHNLPYALCSELIPVQFQYIQTSTSRTVQKLRYRICGVGGHLTGGKMYLRQVRGVQCVEKLDEGGGVQDVLVERYSVEVGRIETVDDTF